MEDRGIWKLPMYRLEATNPDYTSVSPVEQGQFSIYSTFNNDYFSARKRCPKILG